MLFFVSAVATSYSAYPHSKQHSSTPIYYSALSDCRKSSLASNSVQLQALSRPSTLTVPYRHSGAPKPVHTAPVPYRVSPKHSPMANDGSRRTSSTLIFSNTRIARTPSPKPWDRIKTSNSRPNEVPTLNVDFFDTQTTEGQQWQGVELSRRHGAGHSLTPEGADGTRVLHDNNGGNSARITVTPVNGACEPGASVDTAHSRATSGATIRVYEPVVSVPQTSVNSVHSQPTSTDLAHAHATHAPEFMFGHPSTLNTDRDVGESRFLPPGSQPYPYRTASDFPPSLDEPSSSVGSAYYPQEHFAAKSPHDI